jgi:hypothetical protein
VDGVQSLYQTRAMNISFDGRDGGWGGKDVDGISVDRTQIHQQSSLCLFSKLFFTMGLTLPPPSFIIDAFSVDITLKRSVLHDKYERDVEERTEKITKLNAKIDDNSNFGKNNPIKYTTHPLTLSKLTQYMIIFFTNVSKSSLLPGIVHSTLFNKGSQNDQNSNPQNTMLMLNTHYPIPSLILSYHALSFRWGYRSKQVKLVEKNNNKNTHNNDDSILVSNSFPSESFRAVLFWSSNWDKDILIEIYKQIYTTISKQINSRIENQHQNPNFSSQIESQIRQQEQIIFNPYYIPFVTSNYVPDIISSGFLPGVIDYFD